MHGETSKSARRNHGAVPLSEGELEAYAQVLAAEFPERSLAHLREALESAQNAGFSGNDILAAARLAVQLVGDVGEIR